MGVFSNWEEESYREEYVKEERKKEIIGFSCTPEVGCKEILRLDGEVYNISMNELEDLFRPCTKEDPCGACSLCCEEERGSA